MIHVEQHGPVTVIRMARALLGRPVAWTAAYYVDGLLIDCGPRCTERQLLKALAAMPVRWIVLTHAHEETIGGLHAVHAAYPDAPVYASWRTAERAAAPELLKLQRYRRLVWGMPRAVEGVEPLDNIDNRIETSAYCFRAVETPGHTLDHTAYFAAEQRWLFSGHAFEAGREEAWTPEVDLFSLLGSLRMLADLRPERLFPGSGNIRRTPQPELHEKIGSLMQLAHTVSKLEAAGMSTAEISACLFEATPPIVRWTFGHYSALNLIDACRSYNALLRPAPFTRETRDQIPESREPG
ncbi:MAG: MBL fold metallo-hydrolase [Caldilineaceae bacterium]|nr:MBL fold metallo-hydrolase [Caldilineaceae bacterium]